MQISGDTLKELEYQKILEEIVPFCHSEKAKEVIRNLRPLKKDSIKENLYCVNEYLGSFSNENRIPFREYDDIETELKMLLIENFTLEARSFHKIRNLSQLINSLIVHFEKFKDYFPTLHKQLSHIEFTKEIILLVNKVFNRFGEVKNDATLTLQNLREQMQLVRKAIQENFDKTVTHFSQTGVLDEIRESVVDDQRVLAVKSSLKKSVKGRVLGFSKTGSICFILPESVIQPNVRLLELLSQEKKEIEKILFDLTQKILEFYPLLEKYQAYIYELDVIQAKARYADELNAILPEITTKQEIHIIDAYHPILYLTNKREKKSTIPQTLALDEETRIICISGPNAGGKSITLKTVGLVQLMIQSGILVPVHPKSRIGFFNKILTDIGDNQSIENQLSTYSSRLRKMQQIIKQSDHQTLLLIDEFGTGSDPELGGALAESFLEYFYETQSYGIITTHYTNIKLRIEELTHTRNASMLFNEKSLQPIYKLEIGQVGSSFTFEVAEKNKIPKEIIQNAREKIEKDKVNLDKTIVRLQQEKYQVEKLKGDLNKQIDHSEEKTKELSNTINSYKQKLVNFQKLYDEETRYNQLGQRFEKYIEGYSKGKSKKDIIKDFTKFLEQEKYKKTQVTEVEKIQTKKQRNKVKSELKKEEIKEQLEETKAEEIRTTVDRASQWMKEGKRVKIKGSSSAATIDKIEGETAFLNYGLFTTKISVYEIEKI
ncbi:DNA mismatch repair protein MutS [Apibacter sp. HY039]|uniref:endonuclease MutS2 n=1 Tax=Apibacter sp. HY039 TaxID=2501476 RepID=UPI000FEBEAF5|nr:DNA mismatch repair protein MutS [Apibacter sp. HY039]